MSGFEAWAHSTLAEWFHEQPPRCRWCASPFHVDGECPRRPLTDPAPDTDKTDKNEEKTP